MPQKPLPLGRGSSLYYIEVYKNDIFQYNLPGEIFDYINKSYKEGIDLLTAFARFFNYIAGDTGIIFCNPTDKEIKRMLIPVFEKYLGVTG